MATAKKAAAKGEGLGAGISGPNFREVHITIQGDAPYVQNKFSAEAREMMRAKQEAGSQAKKGAKREGKDFQRLREEATHFLPGGICGIPATCFRQAMISACRLVGYKMTLAKLSLFVLADGYDVDDASPLVRITKGDPEHFEACVRNETGVADIRARPKWQPGWEALVRVRYDADQFSQADVVNLMRRVGGQVGIGAGRPDSKSSAGQGWGTFEVVDAKDPKEKEKEKAA